MAPVVTGTGPNRRSDRSVKLKTLIYFRKGCGPSSRRYTGLYPFISAVRTETGTFSKSSDQATPIITR